MKIVIFIAGTLLYVTAGFAQPIEFKVPVPTKNIPHINIALNRIANGKMDFFYDKLLQVKQRKNGTINVVHIGDSHIQADFMSSVVRNGLQQFFGNAGRGLTFPYQLAKSNGPGDINSTSNINWSYNRLAHPEIPISNGITGFCIQTNRPGATINLSLKANEYGPQYFNKLKFFTDTVASWLLQTDNGEQLSIISTETSDSITYKEVSFQKELSSFTLSAKTTGEMQSFYGVSMENGQPGVLYHTIGVNGARYEQYNNTPLFWKQLPALKADLYIISLGTNEAQKDDYTDSAFINQVQLFIQNIKTISPEASILVTTPQDSYKGETSNRIMKKLNFTLSTFCLQNNIAIWDLYKVTNGYGSAKNWFKKGLLNKDKVHFTSAGYKIQGQLLLSAIAKGYNDYIRSRALKF
ncbi:GDSL-type esterase/lipase family protein [Ferruginibacter lapsinanis]|uniref:GDSL-type esterase/lipase family protein n=1 Tax=Ferruginibacter lapsinanis TaxID=563172 RepID=UPI001E5B36CD|nr:GDSL-type esterase/lipase family protein [Ferruginibacter lapsinanis]UEG51274.1 GDSL-type esterase/lipase family protein [Ferruginibacter lapsinanis]